MLTKNKLLFALLATCFALAGCDDESAAEVSQGNISLNVEEAWDAEKNVTYDVIASNAGDPGKINWSVSDTSVLEISSIEQGGSAIRVKALDYGSATITASISNGNTIESVVTVEGLSENVFAVKPSSTAQSTQSAEGDSFASFALTMPHSSGVLNAKVAFEVEASSLDTANSTVTGHGMFQALENDLGEQIVWTGSDGDKQQGYVILYAVSEELGDLFYGVPAQEELTLGTINFKVSNEDVALTITSVEVAGVNELLNVHQYEPPLVTDTASVSTN
ncbi:hypothetical protein JCM19231_388 [Vibrio ishigakensis]|uniref:BIG2 domain-containing protein n=1 Tax=Vibrio ishigakensis TaxID=1481914 RepID=A0A0B8NVH8_9VIBR|nr:Ig-like domain-containing protein [Vibrio ishigakensis]GAM56307.1 hypothetical protein JCM19231_388 [Vibrio ishigakensis]